MESTTESITSTALPVEANASTESPDCKTTFDPPSINSNDPPAGIGAALIKNNLFHHFLQ